MAFTKQSKSYSLIILLKTYILSRNYTKLSLVFYRCKVSLLYIQMLAPLVIIVLEGQRFCAVILNAVLTVKTVVNDDNFLLLTVLHKNLNDKNAKIISICTNSNIKRAHEYEHICNHEKQKKT